MSRVEAGNQKRYDPNSIEWAVHLAIRGDRQLSEEEKLATQAFIGAVIGPETTTARFIDNQEVTDTILDTTVTGPNGEEALEDGIGVGLDTVAAAGVYPLAASLVEGLAVPVRQMEHNRNVAPEAPAVPVPGMYYGYYLPPERVQQIFASVAARRADMQLELASLS